MGRERGFIAFSLVSGIGQVKKAGDLGKGSGPLSFQERFRYSFFAIPFIMKSWFAIAFAVRAQRPRQPGPEEIPDAEHPRRTASGRPGRILNGVWEFQADPKQVRPSSSRWHQKFDFPSDPRVPS